MMKTFQIDGTARGSRTLAQRRLRFLSLRLASKPPVPFLEQRSPVRVGPALMVGLGFDGGGQLGCRPPALRLLIAQLLPGLLPRRVQPNHRGEMRPGLGLSDRSPHTTRRVASAPAPCRASSPGEHDNSPGSSWPWRPSDSLQPPPGAFATRRHRRPVPAGRERPDCQAPARAQSPGACAAATCIPCSSHHDASRMCATDVPARLRCGSLIRAQTPPVSGNLPARPSRASKQSKAKYNINQPPIAPRQIEEGSSE